MTCFRKRIGGLAKTSSKRIMTEKPTDLNLALKTMNSKFGILKRQNSIDILHHVENEAPSFLKKNDFKTLLENEFIYTLHKDKQGKEHLKDEPISQWWLRQKRGISIQV